MKSSELANYAEFLITVAEKEIIQDVYFNLLINFIQKLEKNKNFDDTIQKINSILLKHDFSTFSSKTLLKILVNLGKMYVIDLFITKVNFY